MEKFKLNYSSKNIPIPSHSEYLKRLIEKTEDFIKRLRWRTFYFLNQELYSQKKETFGFRSLKVPPFVPELKPFEDDLLRMIENVKFRNVNTPFQDQLRKDVNRIRQSKDVIVKADKTNNYYSVELDTYQKMMKDNITTTYKRAQTNPETTINLKAKNITERLCISDRVDILSEKPAYITLKDHKKNFNSHPTCRLINPCKNEIGLISKQILDRINKELNEITKSNQWKNSDAVINWFENIQTHDNSTFITFDIVNFYPSITEELLEKAIIFAQQYVTITPEEIEIIKTAKSTLLFNNDKPWQKSNADNQFDVTMGSYDGAETCELVGSYVLSEISSILPKENVGLYRDDGLSIVHMSPQRAETTKKILCKKFADLGLQITADTNAKVTNFLDTTLDIQKKTYKPYMKPDNILQYVNSASDHPPHIKRTIPKSIQCRLSQISSNKQLFEEAKDPYEKALKDAGYNEKLEYQPTSTTTTNNRAQRKRNITWFNPPYSASVQSNIGKKFLNLVNHHFPKGQQLNKILNRNTLKISYSCMDNIDKITKAHNNSINNHAKDQTPDQCNCRNKNDCPLPNKCTIKNVVYEAEVETEDDTKSYIGLTATTFKTRYTAHKASFNNIEKRFQTELSAHIWDLKEKHKQYSIKWKILRRAQPYNPQTKRCNLCLWEKFHIIKSCKNILNSKSELVSTCRHRRKYLLSEYIGNT